MISLITQTLVSKNDPKFGKTSASKPIGPFLTESEAKKLREKAGHIIKKVKPTGRKDMEEGSCISKTVKNC